MYSARSIMSHMHWPLVPAPMAPALSRCQVKYRIGSWVSGAWSVSALYGLRTLRPPRSLLVPAGTAVVQAQVHTVGGTLQCLDTPQPTTSTRQAPSLEAMMNPSTSQRATERNNRQSDREKKKRENVGRPRAGSREGEAEFQGTATYPGRCRARLPHC